MTTVPHHPTIDKVLALAVSEWGWEPGNAGENRVIRALHQLGVQPTELYRQFHIGTYRLDFAYPAEHIAIESDGWVHTTRTQQRRDAERDRTLRAWGWTTYRIDCDEDEDGILRQLQAPLSLLARLRNRRLLDRLERLEERYPEAQFCCQQIGKACEFHQGIMRVTAR